MDNSLESSRKKILIADDDPEVVRILSDILKDHGFDVVDARDGYSAYFTTLHEKPDLILLDIRMADLDGYEVLRRFRESSETRRVPIIMITAIPPEEGKEKALALGAKDYIAKPFLADDLLKKIEQLLKR